MIDALSRDWWIVAIQGLVALLIGILILAWPGITLQILLILFGALVLVDGVFSLFDAFGRSQRGLTWWPRALRGVAGIIIGIVTFVWPAVTAVVLLFLIAAWAITIGVLEIIAAVEFRREISGEWLLAAVGVLSVIFGLILIANPQAGALALVLLIGVYFILLGLLLLFIAFQLRSRLEAMG